MQFFKPFTFFIRKPNGFMNVLCGCVCVLIPVIGPIILLGYRAEVAESLEKDPDLEDYPDFDFNRFMEYLTRGLWPFLAELVVTVVAWLFIAIAAGVGVVVAMSTSEPMYGLLVGALLLVPVTIVTMLLMWPMELYTQLSGGFNFGATIRFTFRFLGRVWGQMLIAALVFGFLSTLLSFAGLLLCIVGVYPAAVIQSLAQQHYVAQLYRQYLDEGGEPIPPPTKSNDA